MAGISQITSLARSILANALVVEQYCTENKVDPPSFDIDGPAHFQIPQSHAVAAEAQASLLSQTLELNQLVSGPMSMLMGTDVNDTVVLHAIYRFGIAKAAPVGRETSYEELSTACGLNVVDLKRILRLAMTRHIFKESRPGYVEHTAASKLLAESQLVHDFTGIMTEEKFKASAWTVDALVKWNAAKDPSQTGFCLGHGTTKGMYLELQDHPERARRWANAMSQFASRIPLDSLFQAFDWNGLGEAMVVDVGGGHGPVSIGLAQRFPNLRFVVQDFPDVVESRPDISSDVARRIEFMGHDVLQEQPVKGAAVYFSRAVFHNYPDRQCVEILRRHAGAMTPSSLIIINESLLHEPGTVASSQERSKRGMDVNMLTYFGSRERNEADWKELLSQADPRLELKSVLQPVPGTNHTIVIGFK